MISSLDVFLVMPKNVPLALGFQYGAPSPVKAGTKNKLSSLLAFLYNLSVSLESFINFKLSRSHCMAEPATKILPS